MHASKIIRGVLVEVDYNLLYSNFTRFKFMIIILIDINCCEMINLNDHDMFE